MLPIVNEDLDDALLDSPWITTDDSDSESEEEQSCVVARKLLTFRVSEEQVVAWKRHNLTGLPCFWYKFCSRNIGPTEQEFVDDVTGNEMMLADLYGGDQDW